MTTVKEIKDAVAKLPETKLKLFTSWFEAFDAEKWDAQFEKDVDNGNLDKLAEKALKEYKNGKCQAL
ncbi:MAG TPA: hypothetical protein DCO75_05860 [Fibrobacteres bacterium]|nr:hypothetical protein [Fibrobacterota bacterium]